MGLSINVGLLSKLGADSPEESAQLKEQLAAVNRVLEKRGIPTHEEPESLPDLESRSSSDMFGQYSLSYLRRFYARATTIEAWEPEPAPDGEDPREDEVLEEITETTESHLLCTSEREGLYLPIETNEIIWADNGEKIPGDMLASSYQLMAELLEIASPLGIELDNGRLPTGAVRKLRRAANSNDPFRAEKTVWLSLYESARLSIEHKTALWFRFISIDELEEYRAHRPPFEPPDREELNDAITEFEVEKYLSFGGCGLVYRGTQSSLERDVAIKIVRSDLDDDRGSRFRREAKTMAKLSHPNIVSVYGLGSVTLSEDEKFDYYAMDFVEGQDLEEMLSKEISMERTVNIICQICSALEYAHAKGVVHRDIKPSNVLIESNEEGDKANIVDFGLAKVSNLRDSVHSRSGVAMGTPHYIAPEIGLGAVPDNRADIYAVGVITYQMLTGNLPRGKYDPVSKLVPKIGQEIDEVIDQALAPNPGDRYQKIGDFARDLMNACRKREMRGLRTIFLSLAILAILASIVFLLTVDWGDPSQGGDDPPRPELTPEPISFATLFGDSDTKWEPGAANWKPGTIGENSIRMKFCWIPGGNFKMGSLLGEKGRNPDFENVVEVELTKGFWIGQFEVTQEDFERVGIIHPEYKNVGKRLPVETITFADAEYFCQVLTEIDRKAGAIGEDMVYRLPTEAQWERACRAGGSLDRMYHGPLDEIAWYGRKMTSPVGGDRKPNAWNVYDMHGNVREFCRGWFAKGANIGGVDPMQTDSSKGMHPSRGGSCNDTALGCRSAKRGGNLVDNSAFDLGFRVVLEKE